MVSEWWDQSLASLHCRYQTFHSRKFFTFSADPLKNTNHNYFMCLFLIVYVPFVGGFWYWITGYAVWVVGITKHTFLMHTGCNSATIHYGWNMICLLQIFEDILHSLQSILLLVDWCHIYISAWSSLYTFETQGFMHLIFIWYRLLPKSSYNIIGFHCIL